MNDELSELVNAGCTDAGTLGAAQEKRQAKILAEWRAANPNRSAGGGSESRVLGFAQIGERTYATLNAQTKASVDGAGATLQSIAERVYAAPRTKEAAADVDRGL